MNSIELLIAIKKHHGVESDYALARILKISRAALSDWRIRGLSDERALQFATELGIDPGPVLAAIHAERSADPKVRKAWETIAKTIRSAAAAVLVVLGLSVTAPQPAQAAQLSPGYTLCVVRRLRRLRAALLAILACLSAIQPANAETWLNIPFTRWTSNDTKWQIAYIVVHTIDWRQTINIVEREGEGYYETNPILGRSPSRRRVDTHFAVTALAHTAISYALPPDWRRRWQMVTIGIEAGYVGYNYSIGLKMDF